jgi:guanylate kinase
VRSFWRGSVPTPELEVTDPTTAVPEPLQPTVFVVCGAGGAGKGSIVSRLVVDDETLHLSRSWTTRPQRPDEPDDAYVFVTPAVFQNRIDVGGFLEWAQFFEHRYGTPTPECPPGSDLVLEIDVQGAETVRQADPGAVVILVLPPSRAEQERRMRHRGDDDAHVAKRLAKSDAEEEIGTKMADLIFVNDDLDRAVSEVSDLVALVRNAKLGIYPAD